MIAVEELNIKSMLNNHGLSKHINDASWNSFMQMLQYKAVASGATLLKNPRTKNSSKRCNNCGAEIEINLYDRTFRCTNCRLVIDRDYNSALNHLKDTVGLMEIQACLR